MKKLTILSVLLFSLSLQARTVSTNIGVQSLFSDSYRSSTGYVLGLDYYPVDFLYIAFQYDVAQAKVDASHPDYASLYGNAIGNFSFGVGLKRDYTVNDYRNSTGVGFYYSLVKNGGDSTGGFTSEIREDFFFYKETIGARLAFQYRYRRIPFSGGPSDWQDDFTSNLSLLLAY